MFLYKTRSLTIRVIKKHVFWLNVELVQKFGKLLDACIAELFFEYFGPACRAACHTVARLLFVGLAGIHIKSHRAAFSKDIGQHRRSPTAWPTDVQHRRLRPFVPHSGRAGRIFSPASDSIYLILYVEFRYLTVFALYRMEIYPAQPMSGSPFRQRQRFRNGELLENIL